MMSFARWISGPSRRRVDADDCEKKTRKKEHDEEYDGDGDDVDDEDDDDDSSSSSSGRCGGGGGRRRWCSCCLMTPPRLLYSFPLSISISLDYQQPIVLFCLADIYLATSLLFVVGFFVPHLLYLYCFSFLLICGFLFLSLYAGFYYDEVIMMRIRTLAHRLGWLASWLTDGWLVVCKPACACVCLSVVCCLCLCLCDGLVFFLFLFFFLSRRLFLLQLSSSF